MAESLSKGVLDNGTTSINDSTSRFVGQIGSQTRQVTASRDAQEIVQGRKRPTRAMPSPA